MIDLYFQVKSQIMNENLLNFLIVKFFYFINFIDFIYNKLIKFIDRTIESKSIRAVENFRYKSKLKLC